MVMNSLHLLQQNDTHYTDMEIGEFWDDQGQHSALWNMPCSTTGVENNEKNTACEDTEEGSNSLQIDEQMENDEQVHNHKHV